jgi:PAS domain-containing protein
MTKDLGAKQSTSKAGTSAEEVAELRGRLVELEGRLATALRDAGAKRGVEGALEQSEARFAALLGSLLDPTVTIDAFGTIQTASDSVERVFGYKPES